MQRRLGGHQGGQFDDSKPQAGAVVHCAIGAIQSAPQHIPVLPEDRLRTLLRQSALAVLAAPVQ